MILFPYGSGKSLRTPAKATGQEALSPDRGVAIVVRHVELALVGCSMAKRQEAFGVEAPVHFRAAEESAVCGPDQQMDSAGNYVRRTVCKRQTIEAWCDPPATVKYVFRLSGMLALLTAVGIELYGHLLHVGIASVSGLFLAAGWGVGMMILLGYGCQFLDSVLVYAVGGGAKALHLPGGELYPAITSLARWSLSFMIGPAALISFAFLQWNNSQGITVFGGLVLVLLIISAIGYWIVGMLVMVNPPTFAYPPPRLVLQAIRHLVLQTLLTGVGVTAAGLIYICLGVGALIILQKAWPVGVVLLWIWWYSAWECSAFALRVLGFWHYRNQKTDPSPWNCPHSA